MNELVQILKNTRQHLMTGVSHMIPFVVSGGILLAVSVMLYGKGAVPDAVADPNLKKLFDTADPWFHAQPGEYAAGAGCTDPAENQADPSVTVSSVRRTEIPPAGENMVDERGAYAVVSRCDNDARNGRTGRISGYRGRLK